MRRERERESEGLPGSDQAIIVIWSLAGAVAVIAFFAWVALNPNMGTAVVHSFFVITAYVIARAAERVVRAARLF